MKVLIDSNIALDYIVTRNISDFSKGNIPAVTPEQFIDIITAV